MPVLSAARAATADERRSAGQRRAGLGDQAPARLVGLPVQQLGERVGGERTGEVVALAVLAVESAQPGHLLGLLDALGNHLQAEGVAELADRRDHDRPLRTAVVLL